MALLFLIKWRLRSRRWREPGDISGAVETDAGTHFIRLEERIAGDSVDYASVKEELRASIEAAEAERNLLIAVEELRDLAFNAPDLSGPAAAIDAEVRVSEPFSLGAGVGIFTDSRLRELAFSDDVKESGNNSEVLELAGQRFVAVQVQDVRAPQIAPFEEVESEVRLGLEAELEALALADMTARAETLLASGESMEAIANTLDIEWRVELAATRLTSQLPQPVLETAFGMPQGRSRCVANSARARGRLRAGPVSSGESWRRSSLESRRSTAVVGSPQRRTAATQLRRVPGSSAQRG
jgi:peptidyl-prolyl cis-trans isomerase D